MMNTHSTAVGTMPCLQNHGEITSMLHAWQGGSSEAHDGLWTLLYGELKKLAGSVLRHRGRWVRDGATGLVHEAYLRLLRSEVPWRDRRHFFAVAARAMRFALADEARRQLAKKRGEGEILSLDEVAPRRSGPWLRCPEEVLSVHQALAKLAEIRPRYAKLVELRYFAGLSVEETSEVLEVTPRTVVRDWKTVRIWLLGELKSTTGLAESTVKPGERSTPAPE